MLTPIGERLDGNLILWKYMRYDYFESMVKESKMYFSSIPKLREDRIYGDQNEGKHNSATSEVIDAIRNDQLEKLMKTDFTIERPTGKTKDELPELLRACDEYFEKGYYTQYFRIGDKLDKRMWCKYKINSDKSIAFATTYGRIISSFKNKYVIQVGPAYYVEDNIVVIDKSKYFVKGKKHEFEKELRLLMFLEPKYNDSFKDKPLVEVDLHELIQQIVIGPDSKEVKEEIKSLLQDNHLNIHVLDYYED